MNDRFAIDFNNIIKDKADDNFKKTGNLNNKHLVNVIISCNVCGNRQLVERVPFDLHKLYGHDLYNQNISCHKCTNNDISNSLKSNNNNKVRMTNIKAPAKKDWTIITCDAMEISKILSRGF